MISHGDLPLFMDSGAHGLFNRLIKLGVKSARHDRFSVYETPEFWAYVDKYAAWLKEQGQYLDAYANVDIIFNAKKTWEVQLYLEEKHGLHPLPVIHYSTPMKWVERYLARGYPYIALGGLGQDVMQSDYVRWADGIFDFLCDNPSRLPMCKTHGFAVTAFELMKRYPWYSVDSTTWLKMAVNGTVMFPPKVNGEYKYDGKPHRISVSSRAGSRKKKNQHFYTVPKAQQQMFLEYLAHIGFSLGKSVTKDDGTEEVIEPGVENDHNQRLDLNAIYYMEFNARLPSYPWPFPRPRHVGLWANQNEAAR